MAEPTAAAGIDGSDAVIAQRQQAVEKLVSLFGFERGVAEEAVDHHAAASDDGGAQRVDVVAACCNYILDRALGQDRGGPVTPSENCPHVHRHVNNLSADLMDQLTTNTASRCSHKMRMMLEDHKEDDAKKKKPAAAGSPKESEEMEVGADGGGDVLTTTTCDSAAENWQCLECGAVRCGRYVRGHALQHWKDTADIAADGEGHCVAAGLSDLSVWCYLCQTYLSANSGVTGDKLHAIARRLEFLKFGGDREPDRKKSRPSDGEEENDINNHDDLKPAARDSNDEIEDKDNSVDSDEATDDGDLMGLLTSAAAARGIPLEWILQRAAVDTSDDDDDDDGDEPTEYPFDSPPKSLEDVANFILSDKCQRIVILAGAGMSVASGIPDFRSADGLYATLNPDLLTASTAEKEAIRADPTLALDQSMFLQNPLPCLELKRPFILGVRAQRWKATLAHRFIELLHAKTGKLVRHYTQNIDGLEDQCTKLPREKVIAVHGSMDRAECARCHSEADFGEFCDRVRSQIKDLSGKDPNAPRESTAIECKVCGYNAMKPSIVLFRSSLPKVFFESVPRDVTNTDLLIVMGTSLRVAPANTLVWRVPRSSMRVLVNREKAGGHLGMIFDEDAATRDYFAEGDIDNVVLDLMDHLGWTEDLEPLVSTEALPESSAKLLREHLVQRQRVKELRSAPGQIGV